MSLSPPMTNSTDGRSMRMVRSCSCSILQHALTHRLGCNELIFNPLIDWWRLGPITKQLRIFLWSDAPVHYKVSMMACTSTCIPYIPSSCQILTVRFYIDMFSYCKFFG